MRIHEYQAKELLRQYGAICPEGEVCSTPEEAFNAARLFRKSVVKAQIHSGGRGKAGGVKIADTPEEAACIASSILGMRLVTKQTGSEGRLVRKVLVTEAVGIRREFYLALALDAERAGVMIIASAEGGTEIEENADKAIQLPVSLDKGLDESHFDRLSALFSLDGRLRDELEANLMAMYRLFIENDAELVEINPLAVTEDGHLMCLDAKVSFDDNALFRHPSIVSLRDIGEEDPREYRAEESGLSYVSLDGDIGCLVNGAGLAMATMDIIRSYGGRPANFLDVGGSASKEKVKAAFSILLEDERVRTVFINIFGGIMKCDVIAEGVVLAVSELGLDIPVVVRLEGTNADKGRAILQASGLEIIAASDMADGARKAVGIAGAGR